MAEDPTERSVERLVQALCALELPPEWELLGVRPQRAEEDVLFPERGQSLVQAELVLRHRITTLQAAPRGEGSSRQTPPEARPSAVPSAGPPRSDLDEARSVCRDLVDSPLVESPRWSWPFWRCHECGLYCTSEYDFEDHLRAHSAAREEEQYAEWERAEEVVPIRETVPTREIAPPPPGTSSGPRAVPPPPPPQVTAEPSWAERLSEARRAGDRAAAIRRGEAEGAVGPLTTKRGSRYWVVLRSHAGECYSPAVVTRAWKQARPYVERASRKDTGAAVYLGLPSQAEAEAFVDGAGERWPLHLLA